MGKTSAIEARAEYSPNEWPTKADGFSHPSHCSPSGMPTCGPYGPQAYTPAVTYRWMGGRKIKRRPLGLWHHICRHSLFIRHKKFISKHLSCEGCPKHQIIAPCARSTTLHLWHLRMHMSSTRKNYLYPSHRICGGHRWLHLPSNGPVHTKMKFE